MSFFSNYNQSSNNFKNNFDNELFNRQFEHQKQNKHKYTSILKRKEAKLVRNQKSEKVPNSNYYEIFFDKYVINKTTI